MKMSSHDPEWDWNTNFDDDVKSSQNWCEISLGSEEEREVKGELVFRRRESESSSKETETKPIQAESAIPEPSRAYQFGMMVVSGAAQVVSNVADAGRRHHDVVKAMERELDDVKAEHEDTKQQLQESQKWATCYESINSDLENRIHELHTEHEVELKKHRQQLKKIQDTCQKAEKDVEISKNIQEKLKADIQELTTEKQILIQQVNDWQSKEEAVKPSNQTNTSSIGTQFCIVTSDVSIQVWPPEQKSANDVTTNDVVNKFDYDALVEKIKLLEHKLYDATNALSIAHSRGEKLRHQLMMSMESMRSQSRKIKESTQALEDALNQVRDLKSSLRCERTKRSKLELDLSKSEQSIRDLNNELEERELEICRLSSLIPTVTSSDAYAQVDNSMFHNSARDIANDVISDVIAEVFVQEYDREIRELKNEVKMHSDRVAMLEFTRLDLLQRDSRFESALKEKNAELETNKRQIKGVTYENTTLRAKIVDIEKITKFESARKDLELKQTQERLDRVLKSRGRDMANLDLQIKQLKIENSNLKGNCSKSEISTQTFEGDFAHEHSQKFEDIKLEKRRLLDNMPQRTDFETRYAEIRSELSHAQTANQELHLELTNERRSSDHVVQRLTNECRRLEWACRSRYAEVTQLRRENMSLQRSYVSTSSLPEELHGSHLTAEVSGSSTTLQTIQEENSSNSSSSVERSDDVIRSVSMTSVFEQEPGNSSRDQLSSYDEVSSDVSSYVRCDVTGQSSRCASRARGESRKKKTKRRQNSDVASTSASSLSSLPIWRRENPDNSLYDETASNGTIDNELFIEDQPTPPTRRFGIPMSSDTFRRVIGGCGNDVDASRDDGYSSSTNIEEANQELIWASTLSNPHLNPPEDRHYYVTYAGVTFDLAKFSMSRMRDVTSSCAATSSPEGMDAFFEFLSEKTAELEGDPNWRGKHNLGKPSDWLDLKGCFV